MISKTTISLNLCKDDTAEGPGRENPAGAFGSFRPKENAGPKPARKSASACPGYAGRTGRGVSAFRRVSAFQGEPAEVFRFCRAARQADISVFREGAAACPGFFGGLAGAFQVCREDRPGRVSVSQEGRPAHFGFAERPGRGGRAFFFRPDPGKAGEAFPSGAGLGQKIKIFRTAGPCLARIVLDFGGYDIV